MSKLELEAKIWSDIEGLNFHPECEQQNGKIGYFKNRYIPIEISGNGMVREKSQTLGITINLSSPKVEDMNGLIWMELNRNQVPYLINHLRAFMSESDSVHDEDED